MMIRSLAAALTIAAAAILPGAALAQFPPPPPTGSQGVFPAPPPTGSQGVFPAAPPPGQGGMVGGKDVAETRGHAIQDVSKKHDRKLMCGAVTSFVEAEAKVVKFLIDNKTTCGVPEQAVSNAKASHEKTVQFREQVCAEQPQPKAPTLSDALGTPTLDTRKNTKTGKGTLDTLTGNPLAQ
jgi:hypothetical protein